LHERFFLGGREVVARETAVAAEVPAVGAAAAVAVGALAALPAGADPLRAASMLAGPTLTGTVLTGTVLTGTVLTGRPVPTGAVLTRPADVVAVGAVGVEEEEAVDDRAAAREADDGHEGDE
jgi:hypothetical protein